MFINIIIYLVLFDKEKEQIETTVINKVNPLSKYKKHVYYENSYKGTPCKVNIPLSNKNSHIKYRKNTYYENSYKGYNI